MGLVAKRDNSVMRGLEFSAPPAPPSREEDLGGESITGGQRFHQSCLCNEVSRKMQRAGSGERLG